MGRSKNLQCVHNCLRFPIPKDREHHFKMLPDREGVLHPVNQVISISKTKDAKWLQVVRQVFGDVIYNDMLARAV